MKISIGKEGDKVNFAATEVNSATELEKIITSTPYSLGVFKDDRRNKANFISAELIGLDFDEGLSIEDATEAFKEYNHIIAPTKHHRLDKKGKVADRFRVILFLSEPITDEETFYATWFSLAEKYPTLDYACKDPSRFWYPSREIVSCRYASGIEIHPVAPAPKEEVKPVVLDQTERGDLSKRTLKFLQFGAVMGTRHDELYSAARDANQNLYTKEWFLGQIQNLSERTAESAYTDEGALLTIDDAFSKEPKHAPRPQEVRTRAFSYVRLGELLESQDKQEDWLVDGLLIKGGLSVIVGIPKIGKTTLVRQLEKCILRGEDFLDRKTFQGSIVHYSFDEKAKTAKRHYKALGLTKDDPMTLHFGSASNHNQFKELEEDLMELKPTLAVVDTLFDLIETEDVNSYAPIKKQLSLISSIAERTGCHIMFVHHQNKPNPNFGRGSGHSVLGSTAIFGSVDCCMIFEQIKDSSKRTLAVKGRGVDSFDKIQLRYNKETQTYVIEELEDIF